MPNIVLVRSPYELVKANLAGYGWPQVNFSQFTHSKDLLAGFQEINVNPGRHTNQIKRFFNIKQGDIVVVPLPRSMAIGYATGNKSYQRGTRYGENRISVEYIKDDATGNVVRIPRNELPEALSTRLKVRMSVVSLNEFEPEIQGLINQSKETGAVRFDSHVEELQTQALTSFKECLLANIRSGKTNLESGGIGLERLVLELIRLEGYSAKITAKNAYDGGADADIDAYREDRFTSSKLLIQVKHYKGMTGKHGVNQLDVLSEDDTTQRWLITTADVSDELRDHAAARNIQILDGGEFVDWLIKHVGQLSAATKNKLGISDVPLLLL